MSSKLVYSTGGSNECPRCRKRLDKCNCNQQQTKPTPGDGIVRIQRESKGRGGKEVTVIRGLAQTASELKDLAKKLKTRCGSGGSVKQDCIEIQGDQRQICKEFLEQAGYQVKIAGG